MVNVQELRHKPIPEIIKVLRILENTDMATVDVAMLANLLNVSVLPRNFDEIKISGENVILSFVTNSKNNSCIFYSDDLSYNKARIMIVQAFAKYIITGNNNFFVTQNTIFLKREQMLANEMLIPESQVKDVIRKLILPTTFTLAKIFQVSQEFVILRLAEIGVMSPIAGYNY